MTRMLGIAVIVLGLTLAAGDSANAQTIGELNAAIDMSNTLNSTGGGPSASGRFNPRNVTSSVTGDRPIGAGPSSVPAPSMPGSTGADAPPPADTDAAVTPSGPQEWVVKAPVGGFEPTPGAQLANLGFENMQNMRWDEAVDAYRNAKEADPRYEPVHAQIASAVTLIKSLGPNGWELAGEMVVKEEPIKVTVKEYYGWGSVALGSSPGQAMSPYGAMAPYGPDGMMRPGMGMMRPGGMPRPR